MDPTEHELPDAGLIVVEDMETGEHLYVDTSDAGFRHRFAAAAARTRKTRWRPAPGAAGADLFTISHRRRADPRHPAHGRAAQGAAPMSDYFSFIWPFMLLSLGLIPLLVWRYRRLRSNQAQAAAALGPLGTAAGGNAALRRRRHIPALFFLAGFPLFWSRWPGPRLRSACRASRAR